MTTVLTGVGERVAEDPGPAAELAPMVDKRYVIEMPEK